MNGNALSSVPGHQPAGDLVQPMRSDLRAGGSRTTSPTASRVGPPGSPVPSLPTPTAPSWGLLATRRWSPRTGLTLRSGLEPETRRVARRRPQRPCHERAIHRSPERSPADNHGQRRGALDHAGPHPHRWQQRPNWLWEQGVGDPRSVTRDRCQVRSTGGRLV
jgi:hypothetical protein